MRTLATLLVPLVFLQPGPTDLSTDYARTRTLRVSSELELDLETTSMEMTIDGEPAEDRGRGGSSSSLVRKAVVTDQILEGSADGARHLKRTFETLHDESTFSFGEDERTSERDFPLAGVTLELQVQEDGQVRIERTDGPEPDDSELLAGHAPGLSLDAMLPEGPVEEGSSWKLDHEALTRALATALDPKLFAETPPEEGGRFGERGGDRGERRGPPGGGRGFGGAARNLGLLEWEGKATLVAVEQDEEAGPTARIELELTGQGELPEPSFRGPSRGFLLEGAAPAPFEGTVKAELRGELSISLTARRPAALELDGEITIDNRFEREREGRTFSSHSVQSGRLTLHVNVEEE